MAFCPSTSEAEKGTIHTILGFKVVDSHERYLGLPAKLGQSRREIFSYLRDRCWARIQGWNSNKLSKAGKETLIKAVLQAIPSYVMSCFLLPKNLIHEIEALIRRFWWGTGSGKHMAWMAWSNLCRPKAEGGMGFRDLKCFNLALLAKQAWRVATKPDLLLSRLLRARYFPNGDFWNASVDNRSSATWKSIITARTNLSEGIRIRIGDGKTTSIWSDPWLVGEGRPKILSPRPIHSIFPNTVADLIDQQTREWNLQVINSFFWPVDRHRILTVPIGGVSTRDKIVWSHSSSGLFTVRTCYHAILESSRMSANGPSSGLPTGDWKHLWHLQIPPKIKVFLCRACSNSLPTNLELYRRKIASSPFCRSCGNKLESTIHVVAGCMGANHVWESAPFHITPSSDNMLFCNWFDTLKRELDNDKLLLAAVVCWKLWERRNKINHNEEFIKMEDVVGWCAAYLQTYVDAQFQNINIRQSEFSDKWMPPPVGVLKLNVDAAFPPNSEFYRVSLIARDDTGTCVWWQVRRVLGRVCPSDGEAQAILQALRTAKVQRWGAITVESDCWPVIDVLQKREPTLRSYGAIVDECLSHFSSFSFCSFSFVKRQGNCLAHRLAASSSLDSMEGTILSTFLADSA